MVLLGGGSVVSGLGDPDGQVGQLHGGQAASRIIGML